MGLILRSTERLPKMQFAMSHDPQVYAPGDTQVWYLKSLLKNPHKSNQTFDTAAPHSHLHKDQ